MIRGGTKMRHLGAAFLIVGCCTTVSFAHYNILLPDKPWTQKGEKVTFTYQYGHPFEHEMFDAPKPAGLVVLLPGGKQETLDIDKTLTKIEVPGADGKKVTAWQFHYTPAERGGHIFALKTPRIKHQEGAVIEDLVKVVLHVQTQNNWDSKLWPDKDGGIDILPNTRPYGILPGMVFKGKIIQIPSERPGKQYGFKLMHVEIEKYNEKPLKNPPADELITFQTKPNEKGYFVTTLPEEGWWGITALAKQTNTEEPRHITCRATLWVHVDKKK
jgi:cobalt/nickel transport protein